MPQLQLDLKLHSSNQNENVAADFRQNLHRHTFHFTLHRVDLQAKTTLNIQMYTSSLVAHANG